MTTGLWCHLEPGTPGTRLSFVHKRCEPESSALPFHSHQVQEESRTEEEIHKMRRRHWRFQVSCLFCCFCCSVPKSFLTLHPCGLKASLSFTISQSLLKLMSIESEMPSNHPLLSPSPPALNLSQHHSRNASVLWCSAFFICFSFSSVTQS